MSQEIVILTLVFGVALGSLFLWLVYFRQYRFVSYFRDMLPYYPFLVILFSSTSILSVLIIGSSIDKSFLLLILLLLTINFIVQFGKFWQWFSNYRIEKIEEFFRKFKDYPKIQVITIEEWLVVPKKNPDKILVLIRHDVDISLKRSQQLMLLEQQLTIPACYYIRNNNDTYTFEEAQTFIQQLSTSPFFEVGFHYESISKCKGDLERATESFLKEVSLFRQIYPLRMVCPHGVSKYHNGLIEKRKLVDFSKLGIFSAYSLPYDYYTSDSGGRHHFQKENKRKTFLQTLEFIFSLPTGSLVQINIHPDWWF